MVIHSEDNSEKIKETAQKADEILKSLEASALHSETANQRDHTTLEKKQFISGPWIASLAALAAVILTIGIQIGVRTAQDLAKQSQTESNEGVQENSNTAESPQPQANPPSRPPQPQSTAKPKEQLTELREEPSNCGEWGCSNDYKFGRIPDREYPNSCAFSQTDSRGMRIVSKSRVEFWACRDEGGSDAASGYKVTWSDGKSTKYTFGPGGQGLVVGLDGQNYPMVWRNGNHNGSSIVIINHEDGAETWIPGSVNL
jgi:hypothetical protein